MDKEIMGITLELNPGYMLAVLGLISAITAGVIAFRKSGSETSQILVGAATDVVVIQKGTIDQLTKAVAEAERKIIELQGLEAEVAEMRVEMKNLRAENQSLKRENSRLRERVNTLEKNGHP